MEFDDLRAKRGGEPSSAVKKRVDAAREVQQKRFEGHTMPCNAQMGAAEVREYCQLDEPCAALMKQAFSSLNMTARSYDRILKVARTIADLDGAAEIMPHHLAEAIQYRSVDREEIKREAKELAGAFFVEIGRNRIKGNEPPQF